MRKALLSALFLGLSAALAASPVGTVTKLAGKVSLFASDSTASKDLKLGQALSAGDRLVTGANGQVALVLLDGTQLKLNYNTDITLRDKDSKGKAVGGRGVGSIKVALGTFWAKVTKKNSRLEFDTPSAVAAVKGTEVILEVSQAGDLCAKLREGKLDISNSLGGLSLGELQQVCVAKGAKPSGVTKWDGKDSWTTALGSATGAEVKILFKDSAGNVKQATIDYSKP